MRHGMMLGLKENLNINFVLPDEPLTTTHKRHIDSCDHTCIASVHSVNDAEVLVVDGCGQIPETVLSGKSYVLRTDIRTLLSANMTGIKRLLTAGQKVNIKYTDIETWSDDLKDEYSDFLGKLSAMVEELFLEGKAPQCNLLTDRILLKHMNNCGAGDENLTLGYDGFFYPCPAFIGNNEWRCGDIESGLKIPNKYLFELKNAPICRICDAFQCSRCIWQNRKMTGEINTPSHEQCVMAHLERNASRSLAESLKEKIVLEEMSAIPEIDYLDPFDRI